MSKYLVDSTDMTAIANAIRSKDGTQTTMTVSDMPTRIQNIPSSGGSSLDDYLDGTTTRVTTSVMPKQYAFAYQTLDSVTLTGNLTSIPQNCFMNSTITTVTIPNTVTRLEDFCFYMQKGMSSFTFPSGLTFIGKSAFRETDLTSIVLPNSLTYLTDWYQFYGCAKLTSVTLPQYLTNITQRMFDGCTLLTSISLPSTITNIGAGAFSRAGLTSISIPSGVTTIGYSAFEYTNITSVTLPASITSVGENAFRYCTSLTSFNMGSKQDLSLPNVEILDGCTNLRTFTFGASGQMISSGVFGGNPLWVKNINFTWDPSISHIGGLPLAGINVGTLHIPSSVSLVSGGIAPSIDNLIVDNPRTYIGGYAFDQTTVSGNITLNQVTFEEYAFNTSGGSLTIHLTETDPTNISNGWAQTDAFSQYVSIKVPVGTLSYYQSALPDYASLISEESN